MNDVKIAVASINNGVYRIYWRSGGFSVASIGRTRSGDVWIAPANWVSGPVFILEILDWIEVIEEIG